jgi:bacillopeptidase F (M6 metalloprotease family)
LLKETISKESAPDGWVNVTVDLSAYVGKTVNLELVNRANGWMCEAAYWSKIELTRD